MISRIIGRHKYMRIKDNFIFQNVADEYIVVPVGDQADRLNGIIKLNSAGAYLWNLLADKERSYEELIDSLIGKFKIERVLAETDVNRFVDQLKRLHCIDE